MGQMSRSQPKNPGSQTILISSIIIVTFLLLFDYISREYTAVSEKQRLTQLKQMVQLAVNSIEPALAEYRAGNRSRATTLDAVRDIVRRMTFEEEHGSNYIFMSSYDGLMLVQPFEPDQEMTDKWDLQDSKGVYIIRELVATARQEGGYVTYHYPPPGSSAPEEKISYVKGIPELECYIGVGRYMGDIRQQQAMFRWKIIGLESLLLIMLGMLILNFLNEIHKRNQNMLAEIKTRKKSEALLHTLIETIPDLIWLKSPDGIYLACNAKFERFFGAPRESIVGKTDYDFVDRELADFFRQKDEAAMRANISSINEEEITYADDGHRALLETIKTPMYDSEGNLIGVLGIARDITERKLMEEVLIQSEKMLSVGGLAAGMAHEINNPLAGILQNVQVIQNRIRPELPMNRQVAAECNISMEEVYCYIERRGLLTMLDTIHQTGRRAAKIVSNMLEFSRKTEGQTRPENLARLLDATIELAANEYDIAKHYDFKKIKIMRDYQQLPPVRCQAGKIQQVILNLLKNAAQAMTSARTPDPQIRISLSLADDSARITIADNGPGMSNEIRRRIFEPFFTTKEPGLGTGLGLSISYFIITEDHGGSMQVESQPGEGTRFSISLPLT